MEILFILLVALAIDIVFGEPSNSWHPVAWMGKLISMEIRSVHRGGRLRQLVSGIGMVLVMIGVLAAPVYFLLFYLKELNLVAYVIVAGIIFKFTFSIRGLRQAATAIKQLLVQDKLAEARISLMSLVSRDTSCLSEDQVVSATVESVAENSCDSFVAPLFYFLLFSVPGAVVYRVINTFDAMIGFHGEWEHLGKFAARFDDVVNFIPARLTALMIVLAAWICKRNVLQAWRVMLRDHGKTESPNAGWTMGAVAGALGVQLEKEGHYKLGDNNSCLYLDTVSASLHLIMVVAVIWSSLSILFVGVYIAAT